MNEDNRNPLAGSSMTGQQSTPQNVSYRGAPREVRSEDLLQGATEVLIRHGQDQYRLRSTSKGKLILTK